MGGLSTELAGHLRSAKTPSSDVSDGGRLRMVQEGRLKLQWARNFGRGSGHAPL